MNCLVKQFAICLGVVATLLFNVMERDNICMCVVNKQFEFELLEFVFDSAYVDLQYDDECVYCCLCCMCVC